MKFTVCELDCEDRQNFEKSWRDLAVHVQQHQSEVLLLPEMPFDVWLPATPYKSQEKWQAASDAHEIWIQQRFKELGVQIIISTRPVIRDTKNLNEAFIWDNLTGQVTPVHHKVYLPNQTDVWESTWYSRGEKVFDIHQFPVNHGTETAKFGSLICSELWWLEHSRLYGKQGAHLIVTPRATGHASLDKWLGGGQVASVVSGCYSLSSNRVDNTFFGGRGWIIDPEGVVLGTTNAAKPFLTLDLNLKVAEIAKTTYPRYIED